MARRVLKAEVSGEQILGRLRLGWMDCVKLAMGSRGMTCVRCATASKGCAQCAKHRKEWRAFKTMKMIEVIYISM